MKRKVGQYTDEHPYKAWFVVSTFVVMVWIIVGIIFVDDSTPTPEVPTPQIVQHEIVVRVEVAQPSAWEHFCTVDDCWWKFPGLLLGGFLALVIPLALFIRATEIT